MKFAKLFDLEDNEQVLVTVNYDDDSESHKLCIRTEFEKATAEMSLSYSEEKMALDALEKYTIDDAEKSRRKLSEFFIPKPTYEEAQ